jgi:hypothetical protein
MDYKGILEEETFESDPEENNFKEIIQILIINSETPPTKEELE